MNHIFSIETLTRQSGNVVQYTFPSYFLLILSSSLNYNHWLVKEACGYLIHPKIEFNKEKARIADVGTGTGWGTAYEHLLGPWTNILTSIWLLELSEDLPSTAKLDGFDISAAQYPPKEWLPENVDLFTQDAFKPFPQDILGTYDVVHLRFALCYVNDEDAEPLLKNLISLLSKCWLLRNARLCTDLIQNLEDSCSGLSPALIRLKSDSQVHANLPSPSPNCKRSGSSRSPIAHTSKHLS